jgi:hypothetical protein
MRSPRPVAPAHASSATAHIPRERRVTAVEIRVDVETLDRVFLVHCERGEPVCLRVNPVDLAVILKSLAEVMTHALN